MLKEQLPDNAINKGNPLSTVNIALYELGDVAKCLIYSQYRDKSVYEREARIALADLITVCSLLAEQMDWDWGKIVTDGQERFLERTAEISNKTV